MSLTYRPDIDGLRAIAILPVLLYHAGFKNLAPSGYVGVDIFFVISGYLITSIILKELEAGTFSITNFYERRIRRIIPALSVVVLATLITASFILLPMEFERFGKSMTATALFLSNMFFWSEAGYFDVANEFKPLLHTWSLAVEEQFYILFPIFLLILHRYWKAAMIPLALAGFAFSLGISEWSVQTNREEHAFYFLPTRAWELGIGSVLAFGIIPQAKRYWINAICIAAGVLLISWSIMREISFYSFPGLDALPSTIGAGFLIYAGQTRTWLSPIIESRPAIFIGKISYSLYLWHWPLIVFTSYVIIRPLTPVEATITLAASFLCAFLTWKFVENPFRGKNGLWSRQKLFTLTALSSLSIAAMGLIIATNKGFPERFNDTVLGYALTKKGVALKDAEIDSIPVKNQFIGASGDIDNITFLLWGDSHATSIAPALHHMGQQTNQTGLVVREAGCLPGLNMQNRKMFMCQRALDAVEDFLNNNKTIKHIYLSARWSAYPRWWHPVHTPNGTPETRAIFEENMRQSITKMNEQGYRVTVITEPPFIEGWNVPLVLGRSELFKTDIDINIPRSAHEYQQRFVHAFFKKLEAEKLITLIDPTDTFCDDTTCFVSRNGQSLYFDDDHMSRYGADLLKPLF